MDAPEDGKTETIILRDVPSVQDGEFKSYMYIVKNTKVSTDPKYIQISPLTDYASFMKFLPIIRNYKNEELNQKVIIEGV